MDKVTYSRRDQSGEPTRTTFNIAAITAANFDAHHTGLASLSAALDALVDGKEQGMTVSDVSASAGAAAGDREAKWLIRCRDTVNLKNFSYEVGTADASVPVLNVGGKTIVDPTANEFTELATAISTGPVRSPYGNVMNLIEVEKVGRNL